MRYKQPGFLFVIALSLATGCAEKESGSAATPSGNAETNTEPRLSNATPPTATPVAEVTDPLSDPLRGTVKETLDSGGYTYLHVSASGREVWAAAKQFPVAVGDEVEIAGLQLMRNFQSKTLGRVFEEIQFVGSAKVISGSATADSAKARPTASGLPPGHPPTKVDAAPANKSNKSLKPKAGPVEKLADGVTVAELFAKKAELAGKIVKFRGRVVKTNRQIMGSNWLHIQDGTGETGTNDITVTSKKDFAAVGSVVVIEGTLGVDRDFGSGYAYAVIVEDATVVADAIQPKD